MAVKSAKLAFQQRWEARIKNQELRNWENFVCCTELLILVKTGSGILAPKRLPLPVVEFRAGFDAVGDDGNSWGDDV